MSVPCDNEGASCRGLGTVKLVVQVEYLAHVLIVWNSWKAYDAFKMSAFLHMY